MRKTAIAIPMVVAVITMGTGCVSPAHSLRSQVSGDVFVRTGHDLGPPKAACDLVFDEWVEWRDGLSEDEAIMVGLWNNPAYQELLADLEITRADIIQAAQLQNPQMTTMLPIGVKQWEFALFVPVDLVWLRPVRVAAAQLESERVAERLVQDGLNVVRDIRLAYIDWQLALQRAELAEQGAALRTEVARVAEARLAAGDVAELDVSAIRLDAFVGLGDAARAARDVDLALNRLRYVLGLQFSDVEITPGPVPESPSPQFDIEQLVGEAISARPDLRAVELAMTAAQERAVLAHRDIWQFNAIFPDINARGLKGFEAGPGMRFNIPLFHQNQGAVARAVADAERLRRQYVNRRDLAAWEVRQAYTQLMQAETDRDIWRDQVLPRAGEAVQSSQAALQESGVSLLLMLETTRQFLNAQQRERDAEAQLRRALAELERSVGHRLLEGSSSNDASNTNDEIIPVPPVDVREETQ